MHKKADKFISNKAYCSLDLRKNSVSLSASFKFLNCGNDGL